MSESQLENTKKHYSYFDVLRVIAIFLVIYTHSGDIGLYSYSNADGSLQYWINLFFLPFSQVSVNLFFMISGALLLSGQESYRDLFKKRIARMVIVTILAILLQYGYMCLRANVTFTIPQFLKSLYAGGIINQQWFLYSYISLLITLPILQKLAAAMENKEYILLFVLAVITQGLCPVWEAISDWEHFAITSSFLERMLLYPLLGYFLHNRVRQYLNRKTFWGAGAACFLFAAANLVLNRHSWTHGGTIAYWFLFTSVYTVSVFWMVEYLWRAESPLGKFIPGFWKFCGSGVFGTYLIENILREFYLPVYQKYFGSAYHLPAFLLWMTAVVFTGICITNLIRLIPFMRKLL